MRSRLCSWAISKWKCRNCGKLGHKASQCKLKQVDEKKMDVICNYCKKSGHVKATGFKLMRKNQNQGGNGFTGLRNGVATTITDVAFTLVDKSKDINNDIWIGDSSPSSHYCNNDNGLSDFKVISERITVEIGDTMICRKGWQLEMLCETA
jgi:Zinc knuckle